MLNPPIENDCKNDAIKKIEKCIFKTISASEKENAKLKAKKEKLINKILKAQAKEKDKNKENKKSELKQNKPNQYKLKIKGSCGLKDFKHKDPFLFELVSANKDCILLKRKKLREKEENKEVQCEIANITNTSVGLKGKIKSKPVKAKKIHKLANTNPCAAENLLDFDRILDEVFEDEEEKPAKGLNAKEAFCNADPPTNDQTNNSNKIKIETKLLIKGNLINKLRKKDQCNLKPKAQKELAPLKEKIAKIEKKTMIKIPNLLKKSVKQKANIKENGLKAEIVILRKLNQEKLIENSNAVVKKIVKICKGKLKKFKKRAQRRDSNLYDINNFVVQNNTNKINERKDVFDIPIPVFKEVPDDFYSNNYISNDDHCADNYFSDGETIEDTSDEAYLKFHNVYEKREFDFRINFYKKKNKKQKCESNTPQENTSVQESNTIDSVIRINCNFLQEEGFLVK